jgi:mycothiol synthase
MREQMGDGSCLIRVLPPGDRRRDDALRLVVGGAPGAAASTRRDVRTFLDTIEAQGLRVDPVVVAMAGSRVIACSSAVATPGKTALVFLGSDPGSEVDRSTLMGLLERLSGEAWNSGVVLLQALLEPELSEIARLYRDAGFRYLTELAYLDRESDTSANRVVVPDDIEFSTYRPDNAYDFLEVLGETHRDSLDCPGLSGLRDNADVLVGHKHTGMHSPDLWFLARRGGEGVGVLLLSQVVGKSCLEVVYLGVVPSARGAGVGDVLMHLAVRVADRTGIDSISLAVDATNGPAWSLYDRWGFVEVARRRAWIRARV